MNSLYKNTFLKIILNLFNIVIPIIIGPYVMRVLHPTQIGNLNFIQSIFGYFFIFAGFGVIQYGIRELSKVKNNRVKVEEVITSLFVITIFTNLIAGVSYLSFVTNKFKNEDIYPIAILFTLYFLFNIFQIEWILNAMENFKFITIKTIIIKIIYVLTIIIFVKSPSDIYIYIGILLGTSLMGSLTSYIYIKRNYKFNFKNIKLFKHLKPMFLIIIVSNANVLYTQLDRYMLGETSGAFILSYYAIAQSMIMVLNSLLLSVVQVAVPRLNLYMENKDNSLYINLLNKVSRIYFMFLFPCCIGVIMLSENLILLYGGINYTGAGSVLGIFAIYMIILGFDNILGNQIMYINKRESTQVKYLFIGGGLNLILNISLIKFNIFNPITAIVSTGFCNLVLIILQHIYIKKYLKIEYNILSYQNIQYLFISLIFIPIIFLVKYLGLNLIFEVIVSILFCGVVYLIILTIRKDTIFYMLFKGIKAKIFKR